MAKKKEKPKGKVMDIPIEQLTLPSNEMRSETSREALEELADSIRSVGVLEPILVRKKDDKFEIRAGVRRYLAAKLAGLVKVPCIVLDVTEEMADIITVHENVYREDPNHLDIAHYLQNVMEKYGWTQAKLAQVFGKSEAWVSQHLGLLKCSPEIKEAVADKQINVQIALQLNRIQNEQKRESLLRYAIQGGATADMVKQWVQQTLADEESLRKRAQVKPGGPSIGPTPVPMTNCSMCGKEIAMAGSLCPPLCPECYGVVREMRRQIREGKIPRPEGGTEGGNELSEGLSAGVEGEEAPRE
ncbi:hypothetical protein DRZ78_03050 [Candidatus Aerophobetes bacterium]|uniref:ParB-like N-terminal domain-containing protein n=1 Tax=Aerophobetes bacterium TaxID=2030807 RepID=A0A662CZK1_UNCAE|nr:MAG: hypothetical protein DRZ78_03050 [Candidatus Aerophobetes bacterium]